MFVMTYSKARQNFASFLDQAKKDGMAIVTRSDGTQFKVTPITEGSANKKSVSPFEELSNYAETLSPKLNLVSLKDILQMVKDEEEERTDRILVAAKGQKASSYFNIFNK